MAIEKQIWIDVLMENFYPDSSFINRSVDMSPHVEYNKINLASVGVDPKVLMDNTTFPVPVRQRTDTAIEVPLHTFDTENSLVRNLEEKETAYAKMDSIVRQHREALQKNNAVFAAHAWAPQTHTDLTPVLATSGKASKTKVKALTFEDVLSLDAKFRSMDVDPASLVMVLSPQHRADLMAEDMKMYKDTLAMGKLFSFSLFDFSQLPYYNASTGAKVALATAAADTDTQCSLIYSDREVMRAMGTVDVFAKYKDPAERGDIIGFQQRFTAMPLRAKYTGAIYSGKVE